MTYTYDLATDVGKVRLLIPDNVEADAVFTDEEITSMLSMEDGIKRTVALCLETLASNNANVMKVIRVHNIESDGASVARALLQRANLLRKQAESDDAEDSAAFDIAEFVFDDFGYRHRILNEALRE